MATNKQIEKLTKLTLKELQQRYKEVVGKATKAPNKKYLARVILETQTKKKTKTKPAKPSKPSAPPSRRPKALNQDFMVLPFRLPRDQVAQMDEARKRLNLKSRTELFRRALHAFLLEAGEARVAEIFAQGQR